MNKKDMLSNLEGALNDYKSASLFVETESEAQNIVNIVTRIDTLESIYLFIGKFGWNIFNTCYIKIS